MRHRGANPWLIGVAAFTLAGAVACERTDQAEPTRQTAPAAGAEMHDEVRSDAGITTAVQARFYAEDAVRGRRIDVTTNEGVVTLSGTVDSDATRKEAIRLAQGVDGVTRVEDRLAVAAATTGAQPAAGDEPGPRAAADEKDMGERVNAGWITTKIQAQYFVNPEINPFNIDVTTTSDGTVTLRGRVDSASDREEAVRIARTTEGVVRVEDQLRVGADTVATTGSKPEDKERETGASPVQPDAWITAKIQSKYFLDEEVKGHEINVDTNNGVVTLRGTVRHEAQKRQAVALARNTDGVMNVRDELTVNPAAEATEPVGALPERGRDAGQRTGQAVDDVWITTKIQSKFFLDTEVKGSTVNVDTNKGVVTLKGEVESEAIKKLAEEIAKGTEGVTKVVNQLTITPETTPR